MAGVRKPLLQFDESDLANGGRALIHKLRVLVRDLEREDVGGAQSSIDLEGGLWHTGTGAPSASLGENGDFYHDQDNDDVYRKSGGAWASEGSLATASASTGIWHAGSGVPASGLGSDDDFYHDQDNDDVYFKASGAWSVVGTLAGGSGSGDDEVVGGKVFIQETLPTDAQLGAVGSKGIWFKIDDANNTLDDILFVERTS